MIRHAPLPDGRTLGWSDKSGLEFIMVDGLYFKDAERTGELCPYEDWRLPYEDRARDLAKRLTIEEIAGLMLYSPHQAVPAAGGPFTGTYNGLPYDSNNVLPHTLTDAQKRMIREDNIRHILLATVSDAHTSAKWSNRLQKLAESLPHSIPVNISSDPRNGSRDSNAEFKSSGNDISKWPEGLGFAATFDPETVRRFAEDASREYRALGITTALGPQIDLCTEPRWMRGVDTLGLDADMTVRMTRAYCDGMQTTEGTPGGWGTQSVNTMVKHFPGGGTGEGGRDAHYAFGKYNVYPGNNAAAHLRPFTEGAFDLDGPTGTAAAVMPYYSVSVGLDSRYGRNVGNSYSEYIIRDLLRGKYGYDGVVCTDWGITADPSPVFDSFSSRCYGMEKLTHAQRCLVAIMNGIDQFGGDDSPAPILEAYRLGCNAFGTELMRTRFEKSAYRLLLNIFRCGLFEDPYLEPEKSVAIVGCEEFVRHGFEAQQASVVPLKNAGGVLPLRKGIKVFVPTRHVGPTRAFFRGEVPPYDTDPVRDEVISKYGTRVATPEEADVAIVFVDSPISNAYSAADAENGGNGYLPITLQYRPYTADAAREHSIAGGDFRETTTDRAYRGKTNIAANESDLDNILAARAAMGSKPVIVVCTLNNPMVMSEFEPSADAILAEFGVSRDAVLSVAFGDVSPSGRLPIQIPRDMAAVETHCEDVALDIACHTDTEGNTYDYGFGLKW